MGSSRTIPAMTSLTSPTLFNFHSTGPDDINGSRGMISMSNSSRSDGLTVAATIDMITAKTMLLQFYNYHDQYSLDSAINSLERLVALTSDTHRQKHRWCWTLASIYGHRYAAKTDPADIRKSILFYQMSVDIAPDFYDGRADHLYDIGLAYMTHSSASCNDYTDVENAEIYFKRAIGWFLGLEPPKIWEDLAIALSLRYEHSGSLEYLDQAIVVCRLAVKKCTEDVLQRRSASAMLAFTLSLRFRHEAHPEDAEELNTFVYEAAEGQNNVEPTLAAQMRDVSMSLDSASTHHGADARPEEPGLDESGPPRRRLAEEWEKLLLEARQVPGFERLLQPRQISELQKDAHVGPIVMLNMGAACHALLVLEDRADVLHVPLRPVAEVEQLCSDLNELLANSNVRSRLGLMKKNRNERDALNFPSAFCLADGRLQLQDIIRKTHPHADFAFLSACQTSTGDQKLSDEAVHLAAGMQLAGYRSIVATMWSIGDEDGPLVADEVYAHLFCDGQPDSSRAANALHHAVLKLQDTTKPDDRDDSWFLRWVPFIHIGA
ncbi:hypothetical protein EWM64_g7836 [Hericium alpestre]|uniref:CHAT domain-containing protein n=1 Tax=Hericium alpestre TaxID=135208 RepID=A0A4Y9ZPI3_9AGAM|nr:hypothetical protein EWM64_g7836 [Hericium alpestre]